MRKIIKSRLFEIFNLFIGAPISEKTFLHIKELIAERFKINMNDFDVFHKSNGEIGYTFSEDIEIIDDTNLKLYPIESQLFF